METRQVRDRDRADEEMRRDGCRDELQRPAARFPHRMEKDRRPHRSRRPTRTPRGRTPPRRRASRRTRDGAALASKDRIRHARDCGREQAHRSCGRGRSVAATAEEIAQRVLEGLLQLLSSGRRRSVGLTIRRRRGDATKRASCVPGWRRSTAAVPTRSPRSIDEDAVTIRSRRTPSKERRRSARCSSPRVRGGEDGLPRRGHLRGRANVAILEWRDPPGLRRLRLLPCLRRRIAFQRGYWDKLSFLKLQGLPAG